MGRSLRVLVLGLLLLGGCGQAPEDPGPSARLKVLSAPDTSQSDAGVSERLQAAWQEFQQARQGLKGVALAETYGRLGMVYQSNHVLAAAAASYENAMLLAPDDMRWRYYYAHLLEQSGETKRAVQAYQAVIDLSPDYMPARLRLAGALLNLGDNRAARDAYDQVLREDPGNATALAGLARVALAQDNFALAAEQLTRALELQPAATRLYHPLGLALRGMGDTQAAKQAFARRGAADTLYPDPLLAQLAAQSVSAQAYLSRALAAASDGRYDVAARAYADAVELDPGSYLARAGLAQALERLGSYDAALAQVNSVLELEPGYALARMQKGRLLERAGDDLNALIEYRLALDADDGYTEARFLLGNALMRLGRAGEAAEVYRRAASELPGSVLVRYRLGLAQIAAGKCSEAARSLQSASDLNASYGPVVQAIVRNYASCRASDAQQIRQALEDGRWLYQQLPDAEHGEALAMALAASGAMDEAVALQRKVLSEAPAGTDAATHTFMRENLRRYQDGQPAARPWPAGATVFLPPRVGERQRPGS